LTPKKKDDPVTGANFWQWCEETAQGVQATISQRGTALSYLDNDLLSLVAIADVFL
jgi:hypothetical protein